MYLAVGTCLMCIAHMDVVMPSSGEICEEAVKLVGKSVGFLPVMNKKNLVPITVPPNPHSNQARSSFL